MKIVDERGAQPVRVMQGADVPNGTFFTGRVAGYQDTLFFKGDDIVSLATGSAWPSRSISFVSYQPVEVEIRIIRNK